MDYKTVCDIFCVTFVFWLMDTPHIDLQTTNFFSVVFAYHSSHNTQPLDVGFFSALKGAWKKSVMVYDAENPGATVR